MLNKQILNQVLPASGLPIFPPPVDIPHIPMTVDIYLCFVDKTTSWLPEILPSDVSIMSSLGRIITIYSGVPQWNYETVDGMYNAFKASIELEDDHWINANVAIEMPGISAIACVCRGNLESLNLTEKPDMGFTFQLVNVLDASGAIFVHIDY